MTRLTTRAIFFIQHDCPVCERASWMLIKLDRIGLLQLTTIDIKINIANEFVDFYEFFSRHLGARHVPVITLGWPPREILMVPRYHTVAGRPGEVLGGTIEGLDGQIAELEKMILLKLDELEEEPAPFPTHELAMMTAIHSVSLRDESYVGN